MLCYAKLCAMLCYAMLCYAMLCYATLCAMLCYAMLCYAMLCLASVKKERHQCLAANRCAKIGDQEARAVRSAGHRPPANTEAEAYDLLRLQSSQGTLTLTRRADLPT